MEKKEPSDHEIAFLQLVHDHINASEETCITESVFSAATMFSLAVFQAAKTCPDGKEFGIIGLNIMIQEGILEATRLSLHDD